MPAPRIPDRQPIGDTFRGVIISVDDYHLLAHAPIDGYETLHDGEFIVRYGIVYLGKPHLSVVPALVALDYGEFKTGEDAWNFLLHKSNLYPRSDVIGHNKSGDDTQAFLKELDLMYPFDILVYADDTATTPLCKVDAIITPIAENVPERLAKHANIFPTVKDWKKAVK
ncbi:MAG: hypothetical protein AAF846_06375 [Chloroflexota bacterium]